jgi:hypothetical protein
MKLELQLPKRIDFLDYHDIRDFQDNLKELHPRLRAKEVGCLEGNYVGVVYEQGFLGSPEVKNLINKIRAEERAEEKLEE